MVERLRPRFEVSIRAPTGRSGILQKVLGAPDVGKFSLHYWLSVLTLGLAIVYFGLYDIAVVSREGYMLFHSNIYPPWPPFSWLGSLGVDVTDTQFYNFTVAIPAILPFFAVLFCVSRWLRKSGEGSGRVTSLYVLHIIGGMMIGFAVSGPGFLFGLCLFLGNYVGLVKLHKTVPLGVSVALMWGLHVVFLFINNYYDGYRFSWFGMGFLDTLVKPLMQWTVHYNMGVLRMIAFNTDMHKAAVTTPNMCKILRQKHDTSCVECALICEAHPQHSGESSSLGIGEESLRCYKFRTELPRPMHEYNLLSYFGYLLYPPLLITGPMSSFNAYASYLRQPTLFVNTRTLVSYAVQVWANLVLLVSVMHYNYVFAILFNRPFFTSISFPRQAVILYLTLAFIWLKFNCVWKFFRLAALLDGVDVPEDMPRCFNNIVSIQGFWRDWHASFNLWIVRYMYVPLGGNRRKHLAIFPIFFFIAIWHDIELRLIAWAGSLCVCFILELLVSHVLFRRGSRIFIALAEYPVLYRWLRITGAVIVMVELLIVNLIGFSVGVDKTWNNLLWRWTLSPLSFHILAPLLFFLAANITIHERDHGWVVEQHCRQRLGLVSSRDLTGARTFASVPLSYATVEV